MPTPGDRIKDARDAMGWTQDQLAEKARISKSFLSDVENNNRGISAEYALKIADALAISLDYLMRGEQGKEEVARQPIQIPPELSRAAEELHLTYSETLMLLEARNAVVARRSNQSLKPPTVDEWKALRKAIKDVFPNVSKARG